MSVSRHQLSAAMSLLELTQADIVAATGISQATISNMIRGGDAWNTKQSTIDKVALCLERRGIEFLPNDGVCRKPESTVTQLNNHEGFVELMKMVLEAAQSPDVDICVSGVDERLFDKQTGDYIPTYLEKITQLYKKHNFNFRIIVEEGDDYEVASDYAQYKRLPSDHFSSSPVYIFGEKVAFIEFGDDKAYAWVINSSKLALAQRKQFNLIWEKL
jgi:transcriptional regulator with XRE-family HTH domain